MRLVLASGSPRRRELLTQLGWPFVVLRPDIDETAFPAEPADQYVARLSREKALAVPTEVGDWIIAADTTVALDTAILGKPANNAEATMMLNQLCDREHMVYTGLTVRVDNRFILETTVTATRVTMRNYAAADIARYVASGDPFDKAGGYAVQDMVFHPVAHLDGCYANVMGLPLCALAVIFDAQRMALPKAITCRANSGRCIAEPAV